MGKKTKKSLAGDSSKVDNHSTVEENHMEAAQVEVETVPSTVVEASEAEVFASTQPDAQTVSTEAGGQAVDSQAKAGEGDTQPAKQTTQAEQQTEQPTEKKPKVDRRPYIPFLTEALEQPQDRKALLKTILEKWPKVSKGGCQTFMTDMLNSKYSHFKDRPVIKLADGKVVFADKAPVAEKAKQETPVEPSPVEAAPEAATQDEQPGE